MEVIEAEVIEYDDAEARLAERVERAEQVSVRDANGRWIKGHKAGGRPKTSEQLKRAFKAFTPDAVMALYDILKDVEGKHKASDRIRAAEVILERGWGRVAQTVELEGMNGGLVVLPTVGGLLPAVDEGTTLASECTPDEQKQG